MYNDNGGGSGGVGNNNEMTMIDGYFIKELNLRVATFTLVGHIKG